MRRLLVMMAFAIILLIPGCSGSNNGTEKSSVKREYTAYSEKAFKLDQPLELQIKSDSSAIEFYTWQKNEVKFEIQKRIKGALEKSEMEKKLEDFDIGISQSGGKIKMESRYKGSKKDTAGRSTDIRVFIPQKGGSLDIKLDSGSVKLMDDIKGELSLEAGTADVSINKIQGKVSIRLKSGNITLSEGQLKRDSYIEGDNCSISVKSELEAEGAYTIKTGTGNVDLKLPANSRTTVESMGNTTANEFGQGDFPCKVRLESKMGRISALKY